MAYANMRANTVLLFVGTVAAILYIMKKFIAFVTAVLVMVFLYYGWRRSRAEAGAHEDFIGLFHGATSAKDDLVPCAVYYTKNVKECDEGLYFQTKEEIEKRLRSPYLTGAQRASLLRVKEDLDAGVIPYPHTCKSNFANWKQLKSHPQKNSADGRKHGHPNTYAYCYSPQKTSSSLRRIKSNKTKFDINGRSMYRYDFQSLDYKELETDFCSQYVVPQGDLQNLSAFHKKWILALKVNKSNGTILDVKSMAVNYQDVVEFSNLYNASKIIFQVRAENGNAVFGANPYTFSVLKIIKNHCDKPAQVSSHQMQLNNVLPIPYTMLMTSSQITNAYGISMEEVVNDMDKPIAFNTSCPFTRGNVRCPGDGAIYYIENGRKRWYSWDSYVFHQSPAFNNVDCTMLRNYCQNGPNMPLPPPEDAVTFYQHAKYEGKAVTLRTGNYRWVESYGISNDSISSLTIQKDVNVIIYQHVNYGGASYTFYGPANWPSMPSGWNDRVSSIRIIRK